MSKGKMKYVIHPDNVDFGFPNIGFRLSIFDSYNRKVNFNWVKNEFHFCVKKINSNLQITNCSKTHLNLENIVSISQF